MTSSFPGPFDPLFRAGGEVDRIDLDEVRPPEVDPAVLVRLVLSCPGVAAMHGGVAGEAATYLPGRRVTGVRILPDSVELHVTSHWPVPARELAAQVWARTGPAVGGRRVDIVIGDVLLPVAGAGP